MKQVACERVWAREGGKDGKGHGLMAGGDSQCQGPGLAHVGAGEEASVDRRRKTGGRGIEPERQQLRAEADWSVRTGLVLNG